MQPNPEYPPQQSSPYQQYSQPQAQYPPNYPPEYPSQPQQQPAPQMPPQYPPQTPPQYQQQYAQQQPYPYPPQYQQQQPYPPQYPPQAPSITVNINQQPPSFLLRVVWYIFIGWWLGGWWLAFGYLCCLTGIGIPLGLVVLNRLPRVLTLRPVNQQTSVTVNGGNVTVNVGGVQQTSFLVRFVYFICLGWWLGGIWASIGYGLCLTVLGLPLGLMMLNRLPAVLTLYKQ